MLLVLHFIQAIKFRFWWAFPTIILAGAGEVAGWIGRYWSSRTPLGNGNAPFSLQYVHLLSDGLEQHGDLALSRFIATIIAPTPLLAANFIITGRIIARLGPQYSRLNARKCEFSLVLNSIQLTDPSCGTRHQNLPFGGHYLLGYSS